MRETKKRKKKIKNPDRSRTRFYIAELLGLVIAAAFFLPQVIFRVQDNILCRDVTLGQRENINVDSLSTSYEASLAERMKKYAVGLAEHENFFMTSQELEPSEELNKLLYSEDGFYQDLVVEFIDGQLLPAELWAETFQVTEWKQYVIYSDNYEEGVNFILWYIALEDERAGQIRLLMDAEDNTIYAIQTKGCVAPDYSPEYGPFREMIWTGDGPIEVWAYYALYYDAIPEDMESLIETAEAMGIEMSGFQREDVDSFLVMAKEMRESIPMTGTEGIAIDADKAADSSAEMEVPESYAQQEEEFRNILQQALFQYQMESDDRIVFNIPWETATLDAVMEIKDQEYGRNVYPDTTIGIRQIYEKIPEFA